MDAVQVAMTKPLGFVLHVFNVHMDFHGFMTYALNVRYVHFVLRVVNVHGFSRVHDLCIKCEVCPFRSTCVQCSHGFSRVYDLCVKCEVYPFLSTCEQFSH